MMPGQRRPSPSGSWHPPVGVPSPSGEGDGPDRTRNGVSMAADPLLAFFTWDHLPARLQPVSRTFAMVAHDMAMNLPDNEERHEAMRKLLEAKDCAVRSVIQGSVVPV